MAKKKPTKAEREAAAKKRAWKNPITGQEPNSFTQVEGVDLSEPKDARYTPPTDPYIKMTQHRARTRSKQFDESRAGRIIPDVPLYGSVDMDEVGWRVEGDAMRRLMGFSGNSLKPNVTSGPAINELHRPNRQSVIGRRAEDLSGPEHRKGTAVLKAYGVTEESATRAIVDANDRANMRSIMAGDVKIAGTGFYGGPSTPHSVMRETEGMLSSSPAYSGTEEDAWAVTATANSLTSPKSKFEQKRDGQESTFPNAAAAHTAVTHALAGGAPEDVPPAPHGGIHENTIKAAAASRAMIEDPENVTVRDFFNWDDSPKTGAYVSAHVAASTPDSYRVSDVLSTQTVAPHLATQKSHVFNIVDQNGNVVTQPWGKGSRAVSHTFEAEDVGPNGLPKAGLAKKRLAHYGLEGHTYQVAIDKRTNKPKRGNSPSEEMLAKSGSPGHAILDRAGRLAAFENGHTPSVNHAQAQNQMQEHDWRDRQIIRPDMPNTMETEHPGGLAKMGMKPEFSVWDHTTW